MNLFINLVTEQTVREVGWILVHSLWQGCALMTCMWVVFKLLKSASSNARYAAASIGLVLMAAAPVVTFYVLHDPAQTVPPQNDFAAASSYIAQPQEQPRTLTVNIEAGQEAKRPIQTIVIEKLEAVMPWCVVGWAAGVAALSLWYLGGWCQLQRLRLLGTKPVNERIAAETSLLSQRLGIRFAVHIAESVLVQVPTMIGWLKPVILLPASALTGLDELQLRAMIAHELAHIKRCDYIINIAQTVVEILGFYHPAVWWMSKQIRVERENCCDDIAAELLQDRTEYAKALYTMEEIRIRQTKLALGANGGSLLNRISRLVGKNENERFGWMPSIASIILIAAVVSATSLAVNNSKEEMNVTDSNELIVYQVNRSVAEFSKEEDFSMPESAYAAINRVMADGSREGWLRVSSKATVKRLANTKDQKVDPEWAKVVLNAKILEVRIKDDRAVVLAQLPQELSSKKIVNPIDARYLALEEGKWLNTGNDRFNTIEQAAQKFGKILARADQTQQAYKEAASKFDVFETKAQELFDNLRAADYEEILTYYDETTGKWNKDGWKKLDLNYRVETDWPSFALWICRTFKDNPIESVELGKAFLSDKKTDEGLSQPAVPYKLILGDGTLTGNLYFYYSQSNNDWHPGGGIDWHLWEHPVKGIREKDVVGEWPTGNCSISGKVVAANTGQPIADARVHLFYDGTFASTFVNSESDGSFEFQNIAPGKYHLHTSRVKGFQDALYDPENNNNDFPQFTLTEGEHRTDIILKPKPAYSIAGAVYDENNEPLKDVSRMWVLACVEREEEAGGLFGFEVTSQARIESDGTYMLDGLDGRPVYVIVKDYEYENTDSFYPACYYPGTLARDEAVKVTFDAGSSAENIDIHLTKKGAFTLEGIVTDEATGKPIFNTLVTVHRRDVLFDHLVAYTDRDGKYRIDSLTAGNFLVHVDAKPWGYVKTRKPIMITAEKTNKLDFTLRPAAKISGRIVDTAGNPVQTSETAYGLAYRSDYATPETMSWGGPANRFSYDDGHPGKNSFNAGIGDYEQEYMDFPTPDTFVIEGMMPGKTILQFHPKSRTYTVKQILLNGADIKDTGFETKPGQEINDVTIVLEDSSTPGDGLN